jgi:hypothetical protein
MKRFALQPFAWGLVAATVLADAAISFAEVDEAIFVSLAFGQAMALGGWLVLGRGHRLLRGAGFVPATVAVTALTAYWYSRTTGDWGFGDAFGETLTVIAPLTGASTALTLCCTAVLRWMARRQGVVSVDVAWRFPVSEILGWMTVVAAASAILRLTAFDGGSASLRDLAAMLLIALVAALVMSLFAVDRPRRGLPGAIVALAAIGALLAGLPRMVPEIDGETLAMIAGSLAYVACWTIAQRLDLRRAHGERDIRQPVGVKPGVLLDRRPPLFG